MFLLSARISGLWGATGPCPAQRVAASAEYPVRNHAICALRLLLLVPVAACVVVAWLAATALGLAWAVVVAPLRRRGATTAD